MCRIQPANSKWAFLIPARRSQKMRGRIQRCLRLPISRDKTGGGRPNISSHRFLISCFCVRVPGLGWNTGRLTFLISRFSVRNRASVHGISGEHISRFVFLLSLGTENGEFTLRYITNSAYQITNGNRISPLLSIQQRSRGKVSLALA